MCMHVCIKLWFLFFFVSLQSWNEGCLDNWVVCLSGFDDSHFCKCNRFEFHGQIWPSPEIVICIDVNFI